MKVKSIFASVLALLSINIAAALNAEQAPYKVVATIGMISDVVENVAGGKADVKTIVASSVDPHLYKPTRNDIIALSAGDIVFYNGLMLEGKMGDILLNLAKKGKAVYAVSDGLVEQGDYIIDSEEELYDPHIWNDVSAWIHAANLIKDALCAYDEANADFYKTKARAYIEKLKELDAYVAKSIASIPEAQRVLVTAHDAFGYMSKAYNIEVKGIQGINTNSEAGIKDIEDLVNYLVDKKIKAIFVESSVSDKNVRALIEGAKAKGHKVSIGGVLFSDAMGAEGTYEGTYIGMLDHNATIIARALGGNAPEKGLNSKLSD